jgi:hypothetical protein
MNYQSDSLFPSKGRSPLRVLIVAEERIHFGETDNGFSLSELINKALIPSTMPWEDLRITTARRFDDEDHCADITNFKFEAGAFGIEKYDQVWLFGDLQEDEPGQPPQELAESELAVLSQFMNLGGGVFATGDHASLGFALCGRVPRVRSMRKWCFKFCPSGDLKAPGIVDTTRLDTLRQGIDPGFQFNDQSDDVPQEIRPKFYPDMNGRDAHPHPLLIGGDFAITVLPDHMHEGECVIPKKLDEVIKFGGMVFDEYPSLLNTDVRLGPEVVAISTSAGGHLLSVFSEDIPPVEPRAFNTIVAYDGHRVLIDGKPIGRVAVDSSFHHFLDINLKGTDSGDTRKRGFYDASGKPTKDYEAFKKYYRNIAQWLSPPTRRLEYYCAMLLDLRFRFPLIEEINPLPEPTYKDYILAGTMTERAIIDRFSRVEALQCVLSLISVLPGKLRLILTSLLDPWQPLGLNARIAHPFLDFAPLAKLVMGASILEIASALPADRQSAGRRLNEIDHPSRALADIVSSGVNRSFALLPDMASQLCRSANQLLEFLEAQ